MQDRFVGVHVFGTVDEPQLKQLMGGEPTLLRQEKCLSAFDDRLPITAVEQKAQMLSAHLASPIVFAACSGQTFLMGRCIMGFTVLRHCMGETAADGLRESHAQSRDFCDQLGVADHMDEVRKLMRERRVDSLAEKVEALTGIRLSAE